MTLCLVCQVNVRKQHVARHRESKMHVRLAGSSTYQMMASDFYFAEFLRNLVPLDLSNVELHMYHNEREKHAN